MVSIILPCRDEEEAIAHCLKEIRAVLPYLDCDAEIIVSDSSSDRSGEIAANLGAKVVSHGRVGYGAAYLEGFKAASGDHLFIADPDCTYRFSELPRFVAELRAGYDLVIGNRLAGTIESGAMPPLNRYFGTPALSWLCRILFKSPVGDINCGMRALTRHCWNRLGLQGLGMDFASEMVIKASREKLSIKELPIDYHCRRGQSKLRPFRDGVRHLKFIISHFIRFKLKDKPIHRPTPFAKTKNSGTAAWSWMIAVLAVFAIGYWLRSCLSLISPLPFSPYDLFFDSNLFGAKLGTKALDFFSYKVLAYPVGYYLSLWSRLWAEHVYLAYILGCLAFFHLGKEISGRKLGGFLALCGFALGAENIIRYTGITYPSGICYVAIAAALYFSYKYFSSGRDGWLIAFFACGLLAITSYHTGAAAFLALTAGIFLARLLSSKELDKKFLISIVFLTGIYSYLTLTLDYPQVALIAGALRKLSGAHVIMAGAILALLASLSTIARKTSLLKSPYLPLAAVVAAAILIILKTSPFGWLLSMGPDSYYSSAVTLNNYFAQAVLFGIYLLPGIGLAFSRDDEKALLMRGWVIGLAMLSVGLVAEGYYARMLDYLLPLSFVLFGWYWSQSRRFRKTVVIATIALATLSQVMILRDPFTLRRYYTSQETASAEKIASLKIDGILVTDLRTAALLNHFGQKAFFLDSDSKEYRYLFYDFEKVKSYPFGNGIKTSENDIPTPASSDYYLVLSRSMQTVLYSTNFPTTPLSGQALGFYQANFPVLYDDGLMSVYHLHINRSR